MKVIAEVAIGLEVEIDDRFKALDVPIDVNPQVDNSLYDECLKEATMKAKEFIISCTPITYCEALEVQSAESLNIMAEL